MPNAQLIRKPPKGNPEPKRLRQITIKLTDKEYEQLEELMKVFRSPSIVHTVRLVVEDAYLNMRNLLGTEGKG